jgi:hypothetical protein
MIIELSTLNDLRTLAEESADTFYTAWVAGGRTNGHLYDGYIRHQSEANAITNLMAQIRSGR